ncbi:TPA: hypothetical protein ACOTG0_000169 [Clostridium perfringens]
MKKLIINPNIRLLEAKKDKSTKDEYKNISLRVFSKGLILKFSFKRTDDVNAMG